MANYGVRLTLNRELKFHRMVNIGEIVRKDALEQVG